MNLDVRYDKDRSGYWVRGLGFNFLTCFASRGGENFLEAAVQRAGGDELVQLSIRLGRARLPSTDLIETLVTRELSRHWKLEISR